MMHRPPALLLAHAARMQSTTPAGSSSGTSDFDSTTASESDTSESELEDALEPDQCDTASESLSGGRYLPSVLSALADLSVIEDVSLSHPCGLPLYAHHAPPVLAKPQPQHPPRSPSVPSTSAYPHGHACDGDADADVEDGGERRSPRVPRPARSPRPGSPSTSRASHLRLNSPRRPKLSASGYDIDEDFEYPRVTLSDLKAFNQLRSQLRAERQHGSAPPPSPVAPNGPFPTSPRLSRSLLSCTRPRPTRTYTDHGRDRERDSEPQQPATCSDAGGRRSPVRARNGSRRRTRARSGSQFVMHPGRPEAPLDAMVRTQRLPLRPGLPQWDTSEL